MRLESTTWSDGPARHEAGSPNVLGAATLAKAASRPGQPSMPMTGTATSSSCASTWWPGSTRSRASPSTRCSPTPPTTRSCGSIGVVNFSVTGYDAGLVAAYLSAEHGVGVRDGKFCAHPLLNRLGLPSGSLRASFGVGSRLEDAQRLIDGVAALLRDGLGWDYVVDAGRWVPANDNRVYPDWAPNTPGTAGAAPCTT